MKFSRGLKVAVGAVGAGLFFGVAFSGSSLISLEVWASATAVTILAVLWWDLMVESNVEGFRWIYGDRANPRPLVSSPRTRKYPRW